MVVALITDEHHAHSKSPRIFGVASTTGKRKGGRHGSNLDELSPLAVCCRFCRLRSKLVDWLGSETAHARFRWHFATASPRIYSSRPLHLPPDTDKMAGK